MIKCHTVKSLITELLELPMDTRIILEIQDPDGDSEDFDIKGDSEVFNIKMVLDREEKKEKKNFINFSYCPFSSWEPEQQKAALELGEKIIDVKMPDISPCAYNIEVNEIAIKCVKDILKAEPKTVLVQAKELSQMLLCTEVMSMVKEFGIPVVCARKEYVGEDGKHTETSEFVFKEFGFI